MKDDFNLPDMKWALQTRASLIIALSQPARLMAATDVVYFFEKDEILQESWKIWLRN